jgi:hypothetical protein
MERMFLRCEQSDIVRSKDHKTDKDPPQKKRMANHPFFMLLEPRG